MKKHSNINWWLILALVVICVPIGFVATGAWKNKQQQKEDHKDSANIVKVDTVAVPTPPVAHEVKDSVAPAPVSHEMPTSEPSNPVSKPIKPAPDPAQQEREKELAAEQKRIEDQKVKEAKEEAERQRLLAERQKKEEALKSNVQAAVSKGQSSSVIPDGCSVVVNGNTMNYQNFRNGVRLGAYSNVRVDKVEAAQDGKTVTRVYVTAKVARDDD